MITRVAEQAASVLDGRIRPTHGYYRQPNKWIKPAVTTALEELKYRREGWEPLPQYGRFDMNNAYAADHPLELLLINGGAKELCEDQIRQQGLHLHPPIVPTCRRALTQNHPLHNPVCWIGAEPVKLPQLESMKDLEPFICRFCDRQSATDQGREQHESVMHRAEKGNIRTGETLATSLTKGLAGQGKGQSQDQSMTLDALTTLTKEITKLKRTRTRKGAKSTVSV